jgi:hypothetical protein
MKTLIILCNNIVLIIIDIIFSLTRGARWSSGQCARRAEAKHQSQWPVIGWVTKIYYLDYYAFVIVITHASFKEG